MASRPLGFSLPQPPQLLQAGSRFPQPQASPIGQSTMQGPKTGFRASFILTALYAYRSNRDRTGKELIRVIEKHQVELLQNLPEGNLCHELVRRGHTRRGLVDIILPRFPIAARAYEWQPNGAKMSLLRHATEKKDRAVVEAVIHATEHLLSESERLGQGEREDLFVDLLDLDDWYAVLSEYPSLIDLPAVKNIFSLHPSSAEVVSDEPGWRANVGPTELKIHGSEVPFPVSFWSTAINEPLPSLLSRQTMRLISSPRSPTPRPTVVNGAEHYGSFMSLDHSRYQHIQPEATGVEVEPSVIGVPDAMRAGPRSLLQLCCDLCERTGRTTAFELEIVAVILQWKWQTFGRPIYKMCLVVSTLLAINYSLSSAYLDPMLRSDGRHARVLGYIWQALLWLNGVPLLLQEALQITSQGLVGYFSEAWNVLDVVSLLLVYVTTTMRFFLLSPGLHLAYHLLSALAALLLWAKLLAYLRGFRETGALIRMICQIGSDMRYFLVVLAISIVGFGNCLYLIFRSDIEDAVSSGRDTSAITRSYGSLFKTFLVLFFALNSNLDFEPIDVSSNSIITAVVYVLYCATTTILLLNLLIAIMSDSYDKVQEHAAAQGRYEQALAIMEIESMLPAIILDDQRFFPRWMQVLRARRTGEAIAADADEWSGRIRQISKKIDASEVKVASQIEHLEERLLAFEARMADYLGLPDLAALTLAGGGVPYSRQQSCGTVSGQSSQGPSSLSASPDASAMRRMSSLEEKKTGGGNGGEGPVTASPQQPPAHVLLSRQAGAVLSAEALASVRSLEGKVDGLERKIDLLLARLEHKAEGKEA